MWFARVPGLLLRRPEGAVHRAQHPAEDAARLGADLVENGQVDRSRARMTHVA